MIRTFRNHWLAISAGALALLVMVIAGPIVSRRELPPASPAMLENIGDRNEKAAVEAAARQRRQSEAAAEATDRAISNAEARGKAGAEAAIQAADASDSARRAENGE